MKVTRFDPLKKKDVTMDLPVTEEQILRWHSGELIQKAMPELTPMQREFLISGISDEEDWNRLFSTDDDEDEPPSDDEWADMFDED